MRGVGKFLGRLIVVLFVVGGLMWVFGPYEKISVTSEITDADIPEDVVAHLDAKEAQIAGLTAGVEKRVVWFAEEGARSDQVIVYVHGFSATSEEIRPVPDQVAAELGANLVFTRLAGHGLDGDALAQASVQQWADDLAEALAVARKIGDEVVIVATSTGATLVAAMADQSEVMDRVAGLVLISPNFAINNPLAALLTMPAARHWVPLVGGADRSWEPQNEGHATYWTTSYPTVAVLQMAALVKFAAEKDYSGNLIPTLFWFSDDDKVVDAAVTREIAQGWGGNVVMGVREIGEAGDPHSHVIAGDILSPGETAEAVREMVGFIEELK